MKKIRVLLSLCLIATITLSSLSIPVLSLGTSNSTAAYESQLSAVGDPKPITDIKNSDGSAVRVACVGDSITYGTGMTNRATNNYPTKLGKLLGSGYTVGNFGKPSSYLLPDDSPYNVKTGKCYTDMAEYTASIEFAPDVVIIMLGTNDIASMVNTASVTAVKNALVNLIKAYQSLSSVDRVYVMTSIYTPYRNDLTSISDGVLQNAQKQAASEAGAEFINIYSLTKDYFDVMLHLSDRLHPNDAASDGIPQAAYARLTGKTYSKLNAPTDPDGVVYVSASGTLTTSSGFTADNPVKSLPYAAGLLQKNGGTIVIMDSYSIYTASRGTFMPHTYGKITITSTYGGVNYQSTNTAQINLNEGYLYLNGDTIFENIKLNSTTSSIIVCNYNDVTFEKSVNCVASSGVNNPVILAGCNVDSGAVTAEQVSTKENCTITVNGGTWHYIRGGNRRNNAGSTMGNIKAGTVVTLTVNGGVFQSTNTKNNTSATGMNNVSGDCNLIINGGTFVGKIYAVNRVGTLSSGNGTVSGNVTVAINNARIEDSVLAIHSEATNVNYSKANIKLIRSNKYDGIRERFIGFDNISVSDEKFILTTASDIYSLMTNSSIWNGYYVLGADIDMSSVSSQTPIGNYTNTFSGVFDGAGYTISGLNIKSSQSAGFFGVVEFAEIRNLCLSGHVVSSYAATNAQSAFTDTGKYVSSGMLVGMVLTDTTIKNCSAEGSVSGNGNVGGLIGMINNSGKYTVTVDGCKNMAVPSNTLGNTGGILSRITSSGSASVGAIIRNCTNYANISSVSNDRCRVGGICAYMSNTANSVIIDNCINNGNITGSNTLTTTNAPYVGGIGGRWELSGNANASFTVEGCINNGTIRSSYIAGGIVGYYTKYDVCTAQTGFYKCQNTAAVKVEGDSASTKYCGGIVGCNGSYSVFSECQNSGEILALTVASKPCYAGGILGYTSNSSTTENGSIINCANLASVTSDSSGAEYAGGIMGRHFKYDIQNCYNGASVSAPSLSYVGAISGCESESTLSSTVKNCYAISGTADKLVGRPLDSQVTKTNVSFLSATAAVTKGSYNGFDFYETWTVLNGGLSLDCFTLLENGDIDADGKITNSDITLAIRHLSGWDIKYRESRFDLNADNMLTNRDAILLIVSLSKEV